MGRKSNLLLALAVAASPAAPLAFAEEPTVDLKARAVALAGEYATSLQTALKGALATSGPVGAISFCHDQAPQIAADISRSSGWAVGQVRTA